MRTQTTNCDILIIGGGPVGLTLALALAQSHWQVVLVDKGSKNNTTQDARALALSHGTRILLENIAAWPKKGVTPIHDVHISQKNGFGRTLLQREDYQIPALGYVVNYADLHASLSDALSKIILTSKDSGKSSGKIQIYHEHTATITADGATLNSQKKQITCNPKLIVHAEGTQAHTDKTPHPSKPANLAKNKAYGQHAIVTQVTASTPHQHRAWERFAPEGPLALLPLLNPADYAVVFVRPTEKIEQIMALDENAFLDTLQTHFGDRQRFISVGKRACYPLSLRTQKTLVHQNTIWIGNSAQTLHPVSGQGLNLGLRDAWQLAEYLLTNNTLTNLTGYASLRHLDRTGSIFFTDQLVNIFSNKAMPLHVLRGLGLFALDLCPPARHFMAKRMIWGARAWP